MKKVILGLLALVLVVVAVCFTLRSSVNSKIDAKIEELKANGFNVNIEKRDIPLKIEANGKIEVAYSEKAIKYLVSLQEESELKKSIEQIVKIFDNSMLDEALEGLTFDYDFNINLLNSKLDLNLYLTKLSNSAMQEILSFEDNKALKSLENMLNNRDFQINIDEKQNYKIKDINYVMPDSSMTIRGIYGDKNNLNIDLIKANNKEDDFTISFEKIKSFYEEKENKAISSKFDIENVNISDNFAKLNIKSIELLSFSKVIDGLLEGNSKIAFEDLVFKKSNSKEDEITIKNSSLDLILSKVPYKQYEDFMNVYANIGDNGEKLEKQAKEFLEALSKAGISIALNLDSKNLNFQNKEWFKTFDLKSSFALSKNLSEMKFEALNDVFDSINIDLKIDKDSATKLVEDLGLNKTMNIKLLDSEDNEFKILKAELKADGLYVNDSLVLPKESLKFPKNEPFADMDYDMYEDDLNLSYSYLLLDKNTLRLNFKYKSSLDKINSGGISVSFPELKDASLIKVKNPKNFKKLDVYKEKDEMYSGLLGKNIKASYLMVEGFDDNWTDINIEKEFSLDIDVSKIDDFLEINLRGYSSNNDDNYELVPTETTSQTQDQQTYFVKIADIDLEEEKKKLK
ncbi:hypothetical protein [Arcobacter vandammei]|uniref:hypothetical protein n=1 Tax=Arcobacter vandammei TaxID=2782243 RepID=UPI0018DF667C|nr:hypothetical protein [Arcobacter vandammei]